jgi:hypothetical protein
MFDYSIKIKVIVISVLVILLIGIFFLINYNNSKVRDLEMITQTRNLATAMEKYFEKSNNYPEIEKLSLDKIQALTENGLNQKGDYLYFNNLSWVKDGSLFSTKDRYIIEFELDNSWEVWNVGGGGASCHISNYLEMICQPK